MSMMITGVKDLSIWMKPTFWWCGGWVRERPRGRGGWLRGEGVAQWDGGMVGGWGVGGGGWGVKERPRGRGWVMEKTRGSRDVWCLSAVGGRVEMDGASEMGGDGP